MTVTADESDPPRTPNPFGILLIVLFGLVVTTPFVALGTWMAARNLAGLTWPQQPADLVDARVVHEHGAESDNHYVDVRYAYTVGGRTYEGTRWTPVIERWDWGSHSNAERELRRLRPQSLTVRVNPYNPSDAAIMVRTHSISVVAFAWGWGFFLVFVVSLGAAAAAQSLDARAAGAVVSPSEPLPGSWKRFGVRDEGPTLHLHLPRWSAAAVAFPVGLGLIGAGLTGFLTAFSPIPAGFWQWLLVAATPFAVLHRLREAHPQTHCILDTRERRLMVRSGRDSCQQVRFAQLTGIAVVTSRSPERPGSRKKHLVFRGPEHPAAPAVVLDLDDWPEPVTREVVRRIEQLTGLSSHSSSEVEVAAAAPVGPGSPLQPYRKTVQSLWAQLLWVGFGTLLTAITGGTLLHQLPAAGGGTGSFPVLFGAGLAALFGLAMAGGALWEAAFIVRLGQPRASLHPVTPRMDEPFRFTFELPLRGAQRVRGVTTALVLREQFVTRDHEGSTQLREVDRLIQQHSGASPVETASRAITADARFRIPADGLQRFRSGDHPYLWVIKVLLDVGRGELYTYDYLLPLPNAAPAVANPAGAPSEPSFDVVLLEAGPGLLKFPRAVQRALPFLNLSQTTDLLAVSPTVLRTGVGRAEAEKLCQAIEAAGGRAQVRERA